MFDRTRQIIKDVAKGAYDWTHQHKDIAGGVAAAGAVGGAAIAHEPLMWLGKKAWSGGKRIFHLGSDISDAVDDPEGIEVPAAPPPMTEKTASQETYKGTWERVNPSAIQQARSGTSPYSKFIQRQGSPYALAYRRAMPGEAKPTGKQYMLSPEDRQMISMRRGWEMANREFGR